MRTPEEFWSRVRCSEACWEWTAARFQIAGSRKPSYGMLSWKGRLAFAHRVAWELTSGPIEKGVLVLHHCDNRICVRPDHLYLGSHADNMRDALARRRMERGEARWNHRLSDETVRAIRRRLADGIATEAIGREFGVSGRTVRYIRSGERWAHVS